MQTKSPMPLDPRAAYELWAPTYPAEAHNPLMVAEQKMVELQLAHITATRALDVGTGSGRYVKSLESTGADVVGIDLSIAMLRRGAPSRTVCGDACRMPFRSRTFDLINASLMVGDVADLESWMHEVSRVLTLNGHLVYSDFHPSWTENGWRRTFRAPDRVLRAIRFEPHTIDQHLRALRSCGFHVRAIREPRLTVAGVATPVVVVFHAVKEVPCGVKRSR